MPVFDNVKTVSSEQIWASPDGQRVIYKVNLEYQGKPMTAKTYSKAITEVGRVGTVETYEKEGRQGAETFVKQPANPNFGGGSGSTPTSTGSSTASPASSGRDDSHIKAQWALGQSMTAHVANLDDVGALDLESVQALATELFHMVDRVKDSPAPSEPIAEDTKQQLDEFFGESEQINLDDGPWGK